MRLALVAREAEPVQLTLNSPTKSLSAGFDILGIASAGEYWVEFVLDLHR